MVAWKADKHNHEMRAILIISQDAETTSVWEALFRQKGCHVISETLPQEAVQTAQLLLPALVLIHLDLPYYERLNLCRELRSVTNGTILLLAPKNDEMEIAEYYYAGVDEFLPTPVNPMALLVKSMAWLVRQEWDPWQGQNVKIHH
jgi:two-component system, OmpR family, response regulator VicR